MTNPAWMAAPNVFVALLSCQANAYRRDAQRELWVEDLKRLKIPYLYFLGGETYGANDEIILNVDDDYRHLPEKVRAMFSWILQSDIKPDWILKVDDDVLLRPDALLNNQYYRADYRPLPLPNWEMNFPQAGHKEHPIGGVLDLAGRFNIGGGYLLSAKAAKIVAEAQIPKGQVYEDRFVCQVLKDNGIFFSYHPTADEILETIAEYLLEYDLVLPSTTGKKRFAIAEPTDPAKLKIDLRHNLPCLRDTLAWIANHKAVNR